MGFDWKLVAAGLCSALASMTVCAADDSAQAVEVTGTWLPGLHGEGVSPVQVITRDEIRRSGVGTLRELLDQVSAFTGALSDLGGNGSFAPGASGASLRYMGKQSTLVLLNSRRVAPYPLADYSEVFTNLDALPFEAIDRVEILKGGASALYGSDAIAGVINIITRKDWVGLQARVTRQQSATSGRFGNTGISLTGGFVLPGDKPGHITASLELYRRESAMWNDLLRYVNPDVVSHSSGFGSTSTYSWPGNIIGSGPLQGCQTVVAGLCRYDRYSRFEAIPLAERANLLVHLSQPLADGRHLFAEVMAAQTRSGYNSPFQPYGKALGSITWGNPNDNNAQTFWYRGLPAGHPLNPTGVNDVEFRYRFVDGPNELSASTLQYRALVGLGGKWRGFEWEAATGAMGGHTRFEDRGWWSLSGFHEVIGNDDPSQVDPQFFNRGYRIGQVNSAAVIDRLFPTYGFRGDTRQVFLDGKFSGALAELDNGPLGLAAGMDLRHEHYAITPSDNLAAGDIVGNGLSASNAGRWVGSVNGELGIPLAKALQAQVALRVDKYGSTASHLSPKLGLRYQASPALLVRASTESAFRAPNLVESANSTKFGFDSVTDPLRCPQAAALSKDLIAAAKALPTTDPQAVLLQARADNLVNRECSASIASIVRNNPDLLPEVSRSYSMGLVFAPESNWKLAVDAWAIDRRNEIGLKPTVELLATEAFQPAGTVNRGSLATDTSFSAAEQARYGVVAGPLQSTIGRFENTFRTRVRGADVMGNGRMQTSLGRLDLKVDAVYLTEARNWSASRDGWGDNLAGRSGYPRWKATSSLTLTRGAWSHTLRAITTAGTSLQGDFTDTTYSPEGCAKNGFTPDQCRVAGWTRWDYALTWAQSGAVTISAALYNMFAKPVPIGLATWLGGSGILPPTAEDGKGRMLRLSLTWAH